MDITYPPELLPVADGPVEVVITHSEEGQLLDFPLLVQPTQESPTDIRIGYDGRVEFASVYTPDAAARVFWSALEKITPRSNGEAALLWPDGSVSAMPVVGDLPQGCIPL